ncbi:cation diffusion facilitator family transporter [Enterobacter ludwigii]|uniref:cation diffusion facilitator family transporter n=1 Tax=Enterobacter ludwigii TaxID=299767 RepID=UPI000699EA5A|nr:cation transporter dimerization domain-containing protein [Enterobacter ludwigii]
MLLKGIRVHGASVLLPDCGTDCRRTVDQEGYSFAFNALHDLMDRSVDLLTGASIKETLLTTPGVAGRHDLKTRKSGALALADVSEEVPGELSVGEGHDIAVNAHNRVLTSHTVLNVIIHIDPHEPGVSQVAAYNEPVRSTA